GSADSTSTTEAAADTTTSVAAPETTTTTTTGPAPETTTTTSAPAPETTTTEAQTTTTVAAEEGARFVLSTVVLGDGAMVVITNIGSESGNLGGYALCQRPSYFTLSDFEVPAGQSVAISLGGDTFEPPDGALVIEEVARISALSPDSGEVGLYSISSFSTSDAILGYVEWGSSGHGRSSVAVAAGIWETGGFVETTAETTTLTADLLQPAESGDWSAS
ncbi:MAG: hypothetical protein O6951_08430, partial [Actinobacteria bacterium]|nr:hypothetical protein [Actinomycetota bacterium]